MSTYHIKVIKGSSEKIYPCDGYTVTTLPEKGYYREHPDIIGLPEGQNTKLVLEPKGEEIYLPRHGRTAFVMNEHGDTIDRYPKQRNNKGMRVTRK